MMLLTFFLGRASQRRSWKRLSTSGTSWRTLTPPMPPCRSVLCLRNYIVLKFVGGYKRILSEWNNYTCADTHYHIQSLYLHMSVQVRMICACVGLTHVTHKCIHIVCMQHVRMHTQTHRMKHVCDLCKNLHKIIGVFHMVTKMSLCGFMDFHTARLIGAHHSGL